MESNMPKEITTIKDLTVESILLALENLKKHPIAWQAFFIAYEHGWVEGATYCHNIDFCTDTFIPALLEKNPRVAWWLYRYFNLNYKENYGDIQDDKDNNTDGFSLFSLADGFGVGKSARYKPAKSRPDTGKSGTAENHPDVTPAKQTGFVGNTKPRTINTKARKARKS